MRRTVSLALAAGAVLFGSISIATPAQAATVSVSVNACPSTGTPFAISPSSVSTVPGDVIQLTNNLGGPPLSVSATGTTTDGNSTSMNPSFTTAAASGTLVISGAIGCGSSTITFSATGGGSSSSTGSDSAPPRVMQQFGKPASGTCVDAAPVTLNWGGASSGGWGESWAQWMNGGLGGAVCTRDLVYSTGAATWGVAQ